MRTARAPRQEPRVAQHRQTEKNAAEYWHELRVAKSRLQVLTPSGGWLAFSEKQSKNFAADFLHVLCTSGKWSARRRSFSLAAEAAIVYLVLVINVPLFSFFSFGSSMFLQRRFALAATQNETETTSKPPNETKKHQHRRPTPVCGRFRLRVYPNSNIY